MNKLMLSGIVKDEPIYKEEDGYKRVSFRVSDFGYADKERIWNVCGWGKSSDKVKSCGVKKGDHIVLVGEVDKRSFTNKDGKETIYEEVIFGHDSIEVNGRRLHSEEVKRDDTPMPKEPAKNKMAPKKELKHEPVKKVSSYIKGKKEEPFISTQATATHDASPKTDGPLKKEKESNSEGMTKWMNPLKRQRRQISGGFHAGE